MVCYGNKWIDGFGGQASLPMTIREECFPGTAFAGCTGYPFPTLSFRAQREIFFVTPFASSFAKPFIGSTAHRLSAIRCFPFLAVGRAPSYRQRKRSLGFARDDDTGRTHFPHTLCMIQRISIPYTVISSAARNLFRHLFPSSFAKPFTGNTAPTFPAIRCFPFLATKHSPSCRQQKGSFAFDDDTWDIPLPQQKSPSQSWSFFCVRKTYLPNCASMVPAATAVPITPATFGPIACIKR